MVTEYKGKPSVDSGYMILTGETLNELAGAVQEKADSGWVASGGVSTSNLTSQGIFIQAMVKG